MLIIGTLYDIHALRTTRIRNSKMSMSNSKDRPRLDGVYGNLDCALGVPRVRASFYPLNT